MMIDIVSLQGLEKQKGIDSLVPAQTMKNFKCPKNSEEAKGVSRTKNALVYLHSYELDNGICKDLQKNKGAVVFSFRDILEQSGFHRSIMLSKMRLALAVCRKNGTGFVVCSMAKENDEVRSERELEAFMAVLGMNQHEIVHSKNLLEKLILETKK